MSPLSSFLIKLIKLTLVCSPQFPLTQVLTQVLPRPLEFVSPGCAFPGTTQRCQVPQFCSLSCYHLISIPLRRPSPSSLCPPNHRVAVGLGFGLLCQLRALQPAPELTEPLAAEETNAPSFDVPLQNLATTSLRVALRA